MKKLWSLALLPLAALVFGATTVPLLSGCSGGVCTAEEENACTTTYNQCVQETSNAGNAAGAEKCADDYCKCYDACGTTCDRSRIGG